MSLTEFWRHIIPQQIWICFGLCELSSQL